MIRLQITLASRYLWGRKLRSFLTTLAILFGTLVIFSMNTIMPTMLKAFESNYLALTGQVDMTITHQSGEAFSESVNKHIKTVPGIRVYAGFLSRTVNIPSDYFGNSKISALTLTGIEPKAAQDLHSYPVIDGRFLRPGDTYQAVISASLAESLGLAVGSEMHLPSPEGNLKLDIVGMLPARALPGNEEVLVTLQDTQKWFDLDGRINTLEINFDTTDPTERDAIQKTIQTQLGEEFVLGGLSSGSEILGSMRIGQAAFSLFGFLALFMGGFIILNTFRTLVAERRHDIGMLRAIGANRSTIIGMILAEGLLQGLVGSFFGILLGYFVASGLLSLLGPMMNSFLHVQLGGPIVSPGLVLLTVGLGIGATVLASLIPAINAGRVTPIEALRPTFGEAIKPIVNLWTVIGALLVMLALFGLLSGEIELTMVGGLMFLVGLVLIAPALVKPIANIFSSLLNIAYARDGTGVLAKGNLTRQPARAAITASTTMIALAIIVGMGGMIWSMAGGFLGIMERSLGSDFLLMPPSVGIWGSDVGAQQDLADKLRSIQGVELVSTMRFASTKGNGVSLSLLGVDPEIYPQVASLTFREGDPQVAFPALSAERSLIANGIFAAQAKLKSGDSVRLSTPTGSKDYLIVAIAGDYLNAKISTAYISQYFIEKDFRKQEDVFFQINLSPGITTDSIEPKLAEVLEDYPQFSIISGKKYLEENRQTFDAIFSFYFVLLGVMAMPSLIALVNTLAIGVLERTREIGMLRAIGAERDQIRRMIVAESLLLTSIGIAFGLLAGLYLGYVLVLGMSTNGFPISYVFPYAGLLAAIAVGLIFGVIAAVFPARQAARMDVVKALHYE